MNASLYTSRSAHFKPKKAQVHRASSTKKLLTLNRFGIIEFFSNLSTSIKKEHRIINVVQYMTICTVHQLNQVSHHYISLNQEIFFETGRFIK